MLPEYRNTISTVFRYFFTEGKYRYEKIYRYFAYRYTGKKFTGAVHPRFSHWLASCAFAPPARKRAWLATTDTRRRIEEALAELEARTALGLK